MKGSSINFCPNCGTKVVNDNINFCPTCGNDVRGKVEKESLDIPTTNKSDDKNTNRVGNEQNLWGKKLGVPFLLLLIPPLGMILMWYWKVWKRDLLIVLTLVFSVYSYLVYTTTWESNSPSTDYNLDRRIQLLVNKRFSGSLDVHGFTGNCFVYVSENGDMLLRQSLGDGVSSQSGSLKVVYEDESRIEYVYSGNTSLDEVSGKYNFYEFTFNLKLFIKEEELTVEGDGWRCQCQLLRD